MACPVDQGWRLTMPNPRQEEAERTTPGSRLLGLADHSAIAPARVLAVPVDRVVAVTV